MVGTGGRLALFFMCLFGQTVLAARHSRMTQVALASMPAVVSISTVPRDHPDGGWDAEVSERGVGAGFLIEPGGLILTAAHVIDNAESITVTLLEEEHFPRDLPARLVGKDLATDSALLQIDAGRPLPVLRMGSATNLEVADWVVVIGSPFGLAHSVTVGVVSYKGRSDIRPNGTATYLDYVQTDAPINPGSSGGPILNLAGEVVAVAHAVNVSGQGIGFGVPIDVAKSVLPQLRSVGVVRRSWLGISVQDLNDELASAFHVADRGVLISDVIEGSPADRAGLVVGDVITEVDATRVLRANHLRWKVATKGVGRHLVLRIDRGGAPRLFRVELVETPSTD